MSKKLVIYIALFLLLLTFSRCERRDNNIILDWYSELFKIKVVYENGTLKQGYNTFHNGKIRADFLYDTKNNLASIQTSSNNSPYGNDIEFYKNGNIKEYTFYSGNKNVCSYKKYFDTSGIFLSFQGSSLVDYAIINNDSILIYFANVFCENYKVMYSETSQKKLDSINTNLELIKSKTQPFLFEARLKKREKYFFKTVKSEVDLKLGESATFEDLDSIVIQ